jgi:lipopolysaccharide export system permease protein
MLFASVLLLGIALLGGLLTDVLNRIARGLFPAQLLFSQIGLRIPWALTILLPLGGFLAVLLSYAKLYRSSEMSILKSGGYSDARLLGPALALGAPLFIILLIVGVFLAPASRRVAAEMIDRANQQVLVAGLEPGRFMELKSSGSVVYVGAIDGMNLSDVLVIRRDEAGVESIVRGVSGRIEQEKDSGLSTLHLEGGERVDLRADDAHVQRASFGRARIVLPESVKAPARTAEAIEFQDASQLLPADSNILKAEWARRIGPAIQALMLILIAIPLARAAPREMRYDRIIIGFMLFVTYSIGMYAVAGLVAVGKAPGWTAIFGIHAAFALLVLLTWRPLLLDAWQGRVLKS